MPFQTRSGKNKTSTWCKNFDPDRECKQRNLYLLGLLTLLIVVVFQIEPNLSENASVYIFQINKIEKQCKYTSVLQAEPKSVPGRLCHST